MKVRTAIEYLSMLNPNDELLNEWSGRNFITSNGKTTNCSCCHKPLKEFGEIDEYELCHWCYCELIETPTHKCEGEQQ